MRSVLLGLMLLVWSSTRADPTWPGADLSEQFSKLSGMQRGGSCHIYSAVALIEAACFRGTGQRIKLSEEWYFFKHLQYKLFSERPNIEDTVRKGSITSIDGGDPTDTIKRFKSGMLCIDSERASSESETLMLQIFVEGVKRKYEKQKSEILLSPTFQSDAERESALAKAKFLNSFKLRRTIEETIESADLKHTTAKFTQEQLNKIKQQRELITQCYSKGLQYEHVPFELNLATELLDAKIPFICMTEDHGNVVLGYDKRTDAAANIVYSFKFKDSDRYPTNFSLKTKSPCRSMIVLKQGSEIKEQRSSAAESTLPRQNH